MRTDRTQKIMDMPISIDGKGIPSPSFIIESVLDDVIDEVAIVKGAMILDGYDEEDSCIHYMNELVNELKELSKKFKQ